MAEYRTIKSEMYEDISSDEEWDDVRVTPENVQAVAMSENKIPENVQAVAVSENTIPDNVRAGAVSENHEPDNVKENAENRNWDNGQASSDFQNMEDDIITISDSDDDATVNTHTIILKMVRRTKTKRDGQSETNREMEIMYSENLDPRNINFCGVAEDILTEVPAQIQALMQRSSTVTVTELKADDTNIGV